jgi:prepilin-type processing-associated H-X9-DG protein
LIELLVVIAIISILAAILFPVFASAREDARRTQCLSNMRQISIAWSQYSEDYDEMLPGSTCGQQGTGLVGGWQWYSTFGTSATPTVFDMTKGSIFPYVKSLKLYICPDDPASSSGDSYASNSCLSVNACGTGFGPGVGLSSIGAPSSTMEIVEEIDAGNAYLASDDAYYYYGTNSLQVRHSGGSNIAFVDGHAAYYAHPNQVASLLVNGYGNMTCQ